MKKKSIEMRPDAKIVNLSKISKPITPHSRLRIKEIDSNSRIKDISEYPRVGVVIKGGFLTYDERKT